MYLIFPAWEIHAFGLLRAGKADLVIRVRKKAGAYRHRDTADEEDVLDSAMHLRGIIELVLIRLGPREDNLEVVEELGIADPHHIERNGEPIEEPVGDPCPVASRNLEPGVNHLDPPERA